MLDAMNIAPFVTWSALSSLMRQRQTNFTHMVIVGVAFTTISTDNEASWWFGDGVGLHDISRPLHHL